MTDKKAFKKPRLCGLVGPYLKVKHTSDWSLTEKQMRQKKTLKDSDPNLINLIKDIHLTKLRNSTEIWSSEYRMNSRYQNS